MGDERRAQATTARNRAESDCAGEVGFVGPVYVRGWRREQSLSLTSLLTGLLADERGRWSVWELCAIEVLDVETPVVTAVTQATHTTGVPTNWNPDNPSTHASTEASKACLTPRWGHDLPILHLCGLDLKERLVNSRSTDGDTRSSRSRAAAEA